MALRQWNIIFGMCNPSDHSETLKTSSSAKIAVVTRIYNILNPPNKFFNSEIRQLSFMNIFLIIIFFLLTISTKLKSIN